MKNFINNMSVEQKTAFALILSIALLGETISGFLVGVFGMGIAQATGIGQIAAFASVSVFVVLLWIIGMLLDMGWRL